MEPYPHITNCAIDDALEGLEEAYVFDDSEAVILQERISCTKNPGHKDFIPVKEITVEHIPKDFQDYQVIELIKTTALLTVKIHTKRVSTARPQFWPGTKTPYPNYNQRGTRISRAATGMILAVHEKMGPCACHKCKESSAPSKVWGEVNLMTAKHAVFDEAEACSSSCMLFYDSHDSDAFLIEGLMFMYANIENDDCFLTCATCDEVVIKRLYDASWSRSGIWYEVNERYKRASEQIVLIVSHPHGCSKQVFFGTCKEKSSNSRGETEISDTKYVYSAPTCPGTSGAFVQILGYETSALHHSHHVHSGSNPSGNFSGNSREIIPDFVWTLPPVNISGAICTCDPVTGVITKEIVN